jgi:hypothetical protein
MRKVFATMTISQKIVEQIAVSAEIFGFEPALHALHQLSKWLLGQDDDDPSESRALPNAMQVAA